MRTLTLTAVTLGDFSDTNTKLTSADPQRIGDLWLEPGDILIERSNTRELVGTTRLYRGSRGFAIFPDLVIRARLNESADPRYIELALQSPALRRYFQGRAKGMAGSMPKIDQQTIAEAPILLPALTDQRRIVAQIEKQFTRLDVGVVALRRVQANLKRYRAAVLKAACEGRLVPTEAELARKEGRTFETGEQLLQRILAERRRTWNGRGIYKVPAGPTTTNNFLPAGWAGAAMRQVGEVQLGRQRAPQHHRGDYMRPYLRVANVFEARIDTTDVMEMNFSPAEFERYRLRYGDILLNEGQTPELVGRPAMFRDEVKGCCYQKTLIRFRAADGVLPDYALTVFRSHMHNGRFKKAASITTNIAHLTAEKFVEVEFPLPPLAEQKRIATEVERRLSAIEELETAVNANLQRAIRLRQATLRRAFAGRMA